MRTSILKILALAFCLVMMNSIQTGAQPAHKAKDRIQELKKMKLLEVLDLDEAASEKFLATYTQYEKKVEAKKSELDATAHDLRHAVKDNASKEEISKLNQKYLDQQAQFFDLLKEKTHAMSAILDDTQYARFLVFENEFPKELQKILFEKRMNHREFRPRD